MDAGDLHKELFKAYASCYPQLSRERAQKAVNAEWKEAKEKYKNSKTPEFSNFINGRVRLYKATAPINKAKPLQSEPNEINILKIGENDSRFFSPIDLSLRVSKEIELPSLKWYNAEETPRLMKISNSGNSIIVTAKWFGPYRPYISGCQLPGTYIFSQAHFHWGENDLEGSEHTVDGKRLPLEFHVMYFKTDYGTPEKAMKELDGIAVLAYLYNVRKQPNLSLLPVIQALPKVVQPYTSSPIELTSIAKLAPCFTDDFFSYWGSVIAQTNYKILWFIHREAQTISSKQLSLFRAVIGADKQPLLSNFRETKSINGRSVFFVNPGKIRDGTLIEAPPDPEEKEGTPQAEDTKVMKAKGKQKASAARSVRRKSAKRKASVRRKSDKHQKSGRDDGPSIRFDEPSVHHEPRVLMTGVSFSIEGDCLSNSSSSASSETSSSRSSCCSDVQAKSGFDLDEFSKKCEHLLQENKTKEEIPFVDISSLMGKGNINAKCEQLLNKLQSCSINEKETCMPILNDLEKYIMATIEKVEKGAEEDAEDELNEQDNLSAVGEGTGFFDNRVNLLPAPTIQEEIVRKKTPDFKEVKCVGASEPLIFNNTCQPLRSPKVQYNILTPPPEWHIIQRYKCEEKQFSEICTKPPTETREIFRVLVNNNVEQEQISAQQPPGSQGLVKLMRNRMQNDERMEGMEGMEINNINQKLWNLELLSNNSVLTGLLQQVTTHSPGVKFISNETMAVVTSQSSTDEYSCSAEPSITQNVSYLASQNTIMKIDQTKSSSSGRFIGQKVEKLRKKKSSVKHSSVMTGAALDKSLKRHTIITEIFQNSLPNQRIVRMANVNSLTTTAAAKIRQENSNPVVRVKKTSKKPVWKY